MTTPLDAIDRIIARTEARIAAQGWANVSGKRIFVVENDRRFFIADKADLSKYHRADIVRRTARVVYIQRPATDVGSAPIDTDFAPVGWES